MAKSSVSSCTGLHHLSSWYFKATSLGFCDPSEKSHLFIIHLKFDTCIRFFWKRFSFFLQCMAQRSNRFRFFFSPPPQPIKREKHSYIRMAVYLAFWSSSLQGLRAFGSLVFKASQASKMFLYSHCSSRQRSPHHFEPLLSTHLDRRVRFAHGFAVSTLHNATDWRNLIIAWSTSLTTPASREGGVLFCLPLSVSCRKCA